VMLQLRNIRQGNLTHKNMTVREAEKIQDVLKVSAPCAIPIPIHSLPRRLEAYTRCPDAYTRAA